MVLFFIHFTGGSGNSEPLNEQQLRSLIDVALVLGDKEWFIELVARLKAVTE